MVSDVSFYYKASLSVVFLLAGIGTLLAQSRSTITGFVLTPDGQPVAQVMVELRAEFSTVGRMRTDGSGRFYFHGLPHGRYTIKAMPFGTGYAEASADVEIAGIGTRGQALAENVQQDIYLKPYKASNAVPFKNAVLFAQEVPKEAESLYKDAISDLDSQRVQTGIEKLEKAVAVFPSYFMALQKLGLIRINQEQFDDAAAIFKRAIEINEKSPDCWYGLAYASYSIRRFPDSATAAEKAVFYRPESMEANLLLGMALRATKDFTKAEQALKKASKLSDDSSPDVHWQMALLYGKDMNKFAEAAKELEAFLRLSPDAPNKEDIKKLIKQFKEKSKPDTVKANEKLGFEVDAR